MRQQTGLSHLQPKNEDVWFNLPKNGTENERAQHWKDMRIIVEKEISIQVKTEGTQARKHYFIMAVGEYQAWQKWCSIHDK